MTEGEVSSKDTESGDNQSKGESTGGPQMGGRFRSPSNSKIDGPAYLPDDDEELVDSVAKRFRAGPRLGSPVLESEPSLDEQEFDDDVDDDSLLAALDAQPEEEPTEASFQGGPGLAAATSPTEKARQTEQMDPLPVVDVEPISEANGAAPAEGRPLVCPSCRAENPSGMRFCVECGGTLEPPKAADESAQLGVGTEMVREPPPPTEAAKEKNPWDIRLVCINEDGSDGKSIPLEFLETTMGRDGDDRFPTDAFLSPKHARFHIEDGDLFVEDLYSLNGTFIKLREETRLTPGDTILMGRQVLRFERFEQSITPKTKSSDGTRYMGSPAPGGNFKVLQVGIGGVIQNVYCLPKAGAVLGREKGDIVFPHDKFMSGRHAQIYTGEDGHCYLVDLNSSNGTWIKIWEKTELGDEDFMFMGQQLFRVGFDD